MIDTDAYEGHTPGPWWIENGFIMGNDPDDAVHVSETLEILEGNEADAQLAVDAPLLLAEVKRLREQLEMWKRWFNQGADNKMEDGDAFDIIFHDDECPMGDNCDGECWNCETNKLKEMIE